MKLKPADDYTGRGWKEWQMVAIREGHEYYSLRFKLHLRLPGFWWWAASPQKIKP